MKLQTGRRYPLLYPFIGLVLAIASVVILSNCSPGPKDTLRVVTIPWPGYESLHLAQSLGYFDPDTIRLIDMANNSQVSMALRNNTADAGLLTLDEVLNLLQDGVDLKVILVMDISNGADAVLARPEINSLQALRGKRVAVENAAVGALILDAMLEKAGLDITDIKLVSKTVNEHTLAYTKNQMDAVVTFEPVRSELLQLGAHVLFDSSQIPGRIVDVLAVRADAMDPHRQALKNLVAAHFRALAYQTQHPDEAVRHLAPYLGVREDQVQAQYTGIKIPQLADNYALLATTPAEIKLTAARLAELMLKRNLLHTPINVSQLAEPMFLPPATK